MSDPSISLNKFISQTGRCSRREADRWIEQGRVTLNDKIAVKGNRVLPGDTVMVDGKALNTAVKTVYLMLHKPAGITCTTDLRDADNVIDFIGYPQRIFPIGRLDKASTGLLLLTNNGDIVNPILREENEHEKEYIVTVHKPVTAEFVHRMQKGVPILGTLTKPCIVRQTGKNKFTIILTQGLNRQIRRMCEFLGYKVLTLKRVRVMHLTLGKLKPGQWRTLTNEEVEQLKGLH